MTQEIRFTVGLDGAAQVQAGLQGVAKGAETLGQAMGRLGPSSAAVANNMGLVGISAGQATNAMRQLPEQITDIVTGLTSGQAPLTVLIQQGGQLKDSFGGVGNVLRALASTITPTAVAIGAVAGTVGAVALAFRQGAVEAEAYRKALVLSGNAAGASVGQLQQTAAAVSALVGTQGKAAEVIAALAASGRVAAADIGKVAEAAIRLEREGGPAIKETVQAFAELGGKDPRAAAEKLNDATNFLTLSLYKQISALQERGKADEAAKLAQEGYATAVIARSKELESKLGSIETVWRKVGDAAKGAWDAMLGIGREESPEQKLEKIAARLKQLEFGRRKGFGSAEFEGRDLEAQADALRLQVLTNIEIGQAESDRQRILDAGIAKEKEAVDARKKGAEEFKRLTERGLELARSLALEEAGSATDIVSKWEALNAARKAGLITTQQQIEAQKQLDKGQPFNERALKLEVETRKAIIALMGKEMEAREKHLESLTKSADEQQRANEKLEDEIVRLRDGEAALQARIDLRQQELIATLDLQAAQALLERGDAAEYQQLRQRSAAVAAEIELRRELSGVKADNAARDEASKAATAAAREWERTADNIRESLTDAFRRAFESGEDFGTAMAKVIERELKARIATALAGSLADGVLGLVGIVANSQGQGGQGSGTLSTANNLATLYSAGSKAYGLLTGGTAATGTSAQFIAGYKGATLAAGQAGPTTAGATGAMGAGSTAGSSAAWLSTWGAAIALGVYKANQDYSAGFRRDQARDVSNSLGGAKNPLAWTFLGGSQSEVANGLSKLGFSDRLADLLSGATAVSALLGRAKPRIEGAGFQGRIAGGDFTGNAFADVLEKGGLFRSDKRYTETSALSEELGRYLDAASKGVLDKAKDFGAALGLPVDALAQVSTDIKVALTDDATKNQAAINEALGRYGDQLVAGFAESIRPLAGYIDGVAETTAQTLARVGASISGVNDVLDALGLSALKASIDGGRAATELEALFGGLGTLQQAAGSYLQDYYTDAERAALATKGIGQALSEVGLSVPATRDAFRDLVQSQNLTTASGREAFAVLMGVAGAFAEIVPAARDAADILSERLGLEGELLTLQGNTVELRRRERELLDESNRTLYDQVKALEDQQTAAKAANDAAKEAAEAAATAADAAMKAARQMADAWEQLSANALSGVQSAYGAVAQAVEAERQQVQSTTEQAVRLAQSKADEGIRALEQQARTIESTFGGLARAMADQAQRLDGLLSGDAGRGAALQVLRSGVAGLAGGTAVDPDALRQAAGTATQINTSEFASALDYRRAVAETSILLRQVGSAASGRQTGELAIIAAQQVAIEKASAEEIEALEKARDAQLYVLDQQLAEARASASTLVRIRDEVKGVSGAIGALAAAVMAARALQGQGAAAAAADKWVASGTTEVWQSPAGAVGARDSGNLTLNGITIKDKLGDFYTAAEAIAFIDAKVRANDELGLYNEARRRGISLSTIDQLKGWDGSAVKWAREQGLPIFHSGTDYVPRTGPALVQEGERIITAADNAEIMRVLRGDGGQQQVADGLARLERRLQDLMAGMHVVAGNTGKAASLLDDVTNGGASLATRAE